MISDKDMRRHVIDERHSHRRVMEMVNCEHIGTSRRSQSCERAIINYFQLKQRSLSNDNYSISRCTELMKSSNEQSISKNENFNNKKPKRLSIEDFFKTIQRKNNNEDHEETIKKDNVNSKLNHEKPSKKKIKKNSNIEGYVITDHFIRRSSRITTSEREKKYLEELTSLVCSSKEDGLEVRMTVDKGRGVFTTKTFKIGDFICEYIGELITSKEAKAREKQYSHHIKTGSYLYFFSFEGKNYCIDATSESNRVGRLINHSRIKNNIYPRVCRILDGPRVIFFAKRNIDINEELLFDYGDRSKISIKNNPWLLL